MKLLKAVIYCISLFSFALAGRNAMEITTSTEIDTIYFSDFEEITFVTDSMNLDGTGSRYGLETIGLIQFVESQNQTVSLLNDNGDGSTIRQTSPNEVIVSFNTNGISLSYELLKASEISVNLYDVKGRLVHQLHNGNVSAGLFTLSKPVSLSRGVYMLVIQENGAVKRSVKLFK